jgi:hypothetical protein
MSASVQVFGCPALTSEPRADAAGVRKAPRHEIAGSGAAAGSGRYGDLAADGALESWECDRAHGSIVKLCMSEWMRSLQPVLNNEGSCTVWEDSSRFARARAWPVENRRKQRTRQRRDLGVIVMRYRS